MSRRDEWAGQRPQHAAIQPSVSLPRHIIRLPEFEAARTMEAAMEALQRAFPDWKIFPAPAVSSGGYRAEKKTVTSNRTTIRYIGGVNLISLWLQLEKIEEDEKSGEEEE